MLRPLLTNVFQISTPEYPNLGKFIIDILVFFHVISDGPHKKKKEKRKKAVRTLSWEIESQFWEITEHIQWLHIYDDSAVQSIFQNHSIPAHLKPTKYEIDQLEAIQYLSEAF